MESTGKYWVFVFNAVEKRGIRVVIANPKWVKEAKGNKDDAKDSKWIGDLFRVGLVKSSEKNRFQNAFTVCNVALDSVASDMFGKCATAITDDLTSNENFDPQHCVSLLHCSLKKKADDVLASIRRDMRSRRSRNTASALSETISTTSRC